MGQLRSGKAHCRSLGFAQDDKFKVVGRPLKLVIRMEGSESGCGREFSARRPKNVEVRGLPHLAKNE